jgi:cation diffusion facilitator family transporter
MAGGSSNNPLKVVLVALVGNGLIAVAKFVAYTFTGSSAMLAEAVHSVADTGNQVLMVLGLKRAQKPPDQEHPYGYGKETYFWSFVVALSIFVLGSAYALYEGVHKLLVLGHETTGGGIENPAWGFGVLGLSLLLEGAVWAVAVKAFWTTKGDRTIRTAFAEGREASLITVLFEDTAAVLGLLVALIGFGLTVVTGNPIYDAIATVLIGVILFVVAIFLGAMTKKLLIGQGANAAQETAIEAIVSAVDGVESIVEIKTLHMGADYILLNLGIAFQRDLQTQQLEAIIDRIEQGVKAEVPAVQRIFIEADSFRRRADEADSPDVVPDNDEG